MFGTEHEVFIFGEVFRRDNRRDGLALLERQQIHDRRAASLAACLRNLVNLQAINLTTRREEQHIAMGRRDEQVLDEVVVFQAHALHTLAATFLLAIGRDRQALHVSSLRHRDNHVFLSDEVFNIDIFGGGGKLRATRRVVLRFDFEQLFLDNLTHEVLVGKNALEVIDLLFELLQLGLELVTLQTGEAAQAHFQNGLRLRVGKAKALGKASRRLFVGLAAANNLDNFVDVIQGDKQAFKNMGALFSLAQFVLGTTRDDVFLMENVVMQHFLQGKRTGHAIDQGQHDNAPTDLQLGMLIELIEHDLGNRVLFELDDNVDRRIAVGTVVHIRNLGQLLVANELAELLHEVRTIHLIGNLGNHDGVLAVLALDDLVLRTNREIATTSLVRIENTFFAHDDATGREIGAGQHGHELFGRAIGVVEHHARRVDSFAQVVGRNIRCHAHSNAVRTIHQQVGEARRKHGRLLQAFVVVGIPVDRFLFKVAQQFHGRLSQTSLGITHSCGRVAIDGAEVAVAVDQRHAHREVLSHANHGVVHRRVAMRVVFTNNVANRTCRLAVRAIGSNAAVVHCIQNAAVNRLQAVAYIGQRAGDDNAHRVFEERRAHLVAKFGQFDARSPRIRACNNILISHFCPFVRTAKS